MSTARNGIKFSIRWRLFFKAFSSSPRARRLERWLGSHELSPCTLMTPLVLKQSSLGPKRQSLAFKAHGYYAHMSRFFHSFWVYRWQEAKRNGLFSAKMHFFKRKMDFNCGGGVAAVVWYENCYRIIPRFLIWHFLREVGRGQRVAAEGNLEMEHNNRKQAGRPEPRDFWRCNYIGCKTLGYRD